MPTTPGLQLSWLEQGARRMQDECPVNIRPAERAHRDMRPGPRAEQDSAALRHNPCRRHAFDAHGGDEVSEGNQILGL